MGVCAAGSLHGLSALIVGRQRRVSITEEEEEEEAMKQDSKESEVFVLNDENALLFRNPLRKYRNIHVHRSIYPCPG